VETPTWNSAYCTELNASELKKELENADKNAAAQIRDHSMSELFKLTVPPTHEELVNFNRNLFAKK